MRDDRDQPEQRHGAPAAALDAIEDRPNTRALIEVEEARIDVSGDPKSGDRTEHAAQRRPDGAPDDAEDQPGGGRKQGARHEQQAGDDMKAEEHQWGNGRIATDHIADRRGIESRPPMPRTGDPGREQNQ